MRLFPTLGYVFALLVMGVTLLAPAPTFAQRQPNPTPSPRGNPDAGINQPPRTYSVAGMVSDAQSNERLDMVKVELREFTGGTVATAFTSGEGGFQFDNIGEGSYEIFVEQQGYQSVQQRVDVNGPTHGVLVELRPLAAARTPVQGSGIVSKRDLLIPHKAHDAMNKGLELLYTKSDYAGSVKQFEHAIQAFPDYYEAYTQMGLAYMKLNDSTNAERVLRKAIVLSDEKYPVALVWMASIDTDKMEFTEAEQLARKAVDLDGNFWQAQSELARALLGLKRPEEAEKSELAAIQLEPKNANSYLLLANIHIALQNFPGLVDDLDSYLKIAPTGQYADQARKQRDDIRQRLQNSQNAPDAPTGQNP